MKQKDFTKLLDKNKKLLLNKRNFLLGKPSGQEGSSRVLAMASLFVIAILLFAAYSYFSGDKIDETAEITATNPKIIKEWEKSDDPAELLKKEKYKFEDLSEEHAEALKKIEKQFLLNSKEVISVFDKSKEEERGNLCFNLRLWFNNFYTQHMEGRCSSYEDDDDDQDEEYEQDTTEVTTDTYQEETTEEVLTGCSDNSECEEQHSDDFSCIQGKCKKKGKIKQGCDLDDNEDCGEGFECRETISALPEGFSSYLCQGTECDKKPICWYPESEWPDKVDLYSCLKDSDCREVSTEREKPYICSENKCLDVSEFSEELTEFCDSDNPCEEGMCKEDEHRCVDCLDNSYCSRNDESCISNECREKSGIKEPCDVDDRADCQENLFCAPPRSSLGPDFANSVCWYKKGSIDMDFCKHSSECFNMEKETGEDYICVGFHETKKCVKASEQPQNVEYCDYITPCEDSENFFCSELDGYCKEKIEINQPCSEKEKSKNQCFGKNECVLETCRLRLHRGDTCQQSEECPGQCAPVEKLPSGGYDLNGRKECTWEPQLEGEPCDPSRGILACFYGANVPLICDKELAMCVPEEKEEPALIAQKR
ncbi:hypothetical protein ACFL0W_00950 [Nanoarchaeota archaeon]